MKFNEVKCNLFNVDKKYTLMHCISLDCAMGAGIAKQFTNLYPKMKNYIKEVIKYEQITGNWAIHYRGDEHHDVINLITKKRYFNKPTYESLTESLLKAKEICLSENIKDIAMPLIGCGLDRLSWKFVRPRVEEIFSDTDINILVCVYRGA